MKKSVFLSDCFNFKCMPKWSSFGLKWLMIKWINVAK